MRVLLRHEVRKHRVVLALVPLGLFAFHLLITRVAPSPEQTAQFGTMLSFLPPEILRVVGLHDAMSVTGRGVLSFGYVHPFTIILLSLWTVRVAASDLAGEIGDGTMDLLGSRPVGRLTHLLSVAGFIAVGIVLGTAAAWCGTALGLATRDMGDIRAGEFVGVAAGLALLFAAWAGFALAVSALSRRGGGAIAIVAGVLAGMFALDYIGRLYAPLKLARYASPFMYFAPHQQRYLSAGDVAVLVSIAVAGLATALLAFRRRDL